MYMNKRISDILNDLQTIDPAFKAENFELEKLVSELIINKPDTHFDESFASNLRTQLLNTKIKPMPSPYSSFFVSRVFYGILGSALTILIVVPFTYVATQKATSPDKPIVLNPFSTQVKDVSSGLSPKQQISNKGINAFGTLALVATGTESSTKTKNPTPLNATNQAAVSPKSSTNKTSAVTYGYTGESLTLRDNQGKVFKRTKGADSGKQLVGIINNGSFTLTNLPSFNNLSLKNVTLAEDTDHGYLINVNFADGSISINPNTPSWNTTSTTTSTLDETEVLSIAQDFVSGHGIDTSAYGKPVVLDNKTVIYPLIIEGKEVYEETGNPFGLVLTIDLQAKKVSNAENLTSQTYESSLYTLETNFNNVVAVATSSLNSTLLQGIAGTTTKASLDTPKFVLMHYWLADNGGVSSELFIPALSFPISYKNIQNSTGLPTTIVVPLVKDFLTKHNKTE
jgi:hypothetical protein